MKPGDHVYITDPVTKRVLTRTVLEIADHNPCDGSPERDVIVRFVEGDWAFRWNCTEDKA